MKKKLQKDLCLFLCGAVLCGTACTLPAAAEDSGYALADYKNLEALVVYKDGASEVRTYGDEAELAAGLKILGSDGDVACVQPNYSYTASSDSDPLYTDQWALYNDGSFELATNQNDYPVFDSPFGEPSAPRDWNGPARQSTMAKASSAVTAVSGVDVNAEEAWDIYDGGSRDVVVALIDTGVDSSHEDLQGVLWTNTDEIAGNGIDDDGDGYIDDVSGWDFYDDTATASISSDDDHGTHCAGSIAANQDNGAGVTGLVGDTSHVQIMSLKVLGGKDGEGSTADIIKAIQYAEANGASIVNLSLGSNYFDYALYQTIKNSDMLFVVAAGNDGADSDQTPCYPASFNLSNIIAVANLNCDGTLSDSSNYGAASVDIAAPGSYILSTTTDNSYSYMTGTSMAAPLVTAAAAMVYSYDTGATLSQVRQILLDSASEQSGLSGKVSSGGMLDVAAALKYDLSDVSTDENEETVSAGSVPELSYTTSQQNGRTVLTLSATDADGDLGGVYYAEGTLTASDFAYGNNGTPFTLENGSASFLVFGSGTVTFYAVDMAGNESVLTVEVDGSSESSTAPGNSDSTTGVSTVPSDSGGMPGEETGNAPSRPMVPSTPQMPGRGMHR